MDSSFNNLLIVDDDKAITKIFERVAKDHNWSYSVARNGQEALDILRGQFFEVAVVDIRMPGYTGMQLLEYIKSNHLPSEVIMITAAGTVESAVNSIKQGAYDYLTKPFDDLDKVSLLIEKAMERNRLVRKLHILERKSSDGTEFESILGRSPRMQEIYSMIEAIAPVASTVLIMGESGTGKELVAKAIHKRSLRADKPFVVVNCAAIPEQLLESELFGHKKGSFTGAVSDKNGLLAEANEGTVFLDEIAEIPPLLQVKILRFLQEGEIKPVGDTDAINVDVRILAATNVNLIKAVHEGKFREDLYYRLNVISVNLPPLRERADDIPLLAHHFLQKFNERAKKNIKSISIDAMQVLQHGKWVGNVRELENVIERAVVLANGDVITAQDLPAKVLGDSFYVAKDEVDDDISQLSYRIAKNKALAAFNRTYIGALLKATSGNISFAAQRSGMDRSNFKKLIKRYKVDAGKFK